LLNEKKTRFKYYRKFLFKIPSLHQHAIYRNTHKSQTLTSPIQSVCALFSFGIQKSIFAYLHSSFVTFKNLNRSHYNDPEIVCRRQSFLYILIYCTCTGRFAGRSI